MNKGFSIVEILVSIGIFSIIVFAVINVFVVSNEASQIGNAKTKAIPLMNEYLEKVRNIRRSDWNLLTDNRYIILDQGNTIALQQSAVGETVGDFTRSIDIEPAYRDASGNLVQNPGTIDPSTKKITVTISWIGVHPGQLAETTYLTRYLDNLAWTQTTYADFAPPVGTHYGTVAINNSGGEVVLGSGGSGDWCDPNLSITAMDLPKSGVAKAVTAIEGQAFAGTGENASGESFVNITITNTNPPVASILGVKDGYKTNDIFGEANYGYIATDTNSKEVVILNISSTPYSEVGYFNIPGSTDGNSIFVSSSTGYVTENSKLWNFDLSSKIGSRSAVDSDGVTLAGTGNSVVVHGSYAYVAVGAMTKQLQIVDLSNPAAMQVVGWADLPAQGATDVFINETASRAYVVTSASASQREFFIINIDVEPKTGAMSIVSSYDTNGMNPKGVEVVPGARAIIVGTGGEEYQVVQMSTETNPVRCGGLQINSGVYDSASLLESDNDAYTYIVTGDTGSEFKMIEGGPGGQYSASGIFESQTKDTTYSTAFNRFFVNASVPSQTTITYRIAIKDAVGGTCTGVVFSDFDFVGPDGTIVSRFTGDDAIPLDDNGSGFENPGQCARVRAYLTTSDFSKTPTLYDFTLNYSP